MKTKLISLIKSIFILFNTHMPKEQVKEKTNIFLKKVHLI